MTTATPFLDGKHQCPKCELWLLPSAFGVSKRNKHKGIVSLCKKCRNAYTSDWYKNNKEVRQRHVTEERDALRVEVRRAYGDRCSCCRETEPLFLTMDHVNRDGKQHRKLVGSGLSFYRWLRMNEFPKEGFRLLCYNCNCGRERNGGTCPHEQNRKIDRSNARI